MFMPYLRSQHGVLLTLPLSSGGQAHMLMLMPTPETPRAQPSTIDSAHAPAPPSIVTISRPSHGA